MIDHERCFRMSALNALDSLLKAACDNPGIEFQRVAAALCGGSGSEAGFDYEIAIAIINQVPAVQRVGSDSRELRLRFFLLQLLTHLRPSWRRLLPKGRLYLQDYLDEDAQAVFEIAGLYGEPSPDVRNWWDQMSGFIRGLADEQRLATGRTAEEMTLRYEQERLTAMGHANLVPVWVGFEDNSLGYDVRSYAITANGILRPKYIEVKATTADEPRFYLTRNEWRTAQRYPEEFVVYLWDLKIPKLTEISVQELSAHLPENRGRGLWDVTIVGWP